MFHRAYFMHEVGDAPDVGLIFAEHVFLLIYEFI